MVTVILAVAWVTSPIEPVAWIPPVKSELVGPYAPNDRLTPVEWWAKELIGPEAITVAPDGTLLAGLKDGRIVKLQVGSDRADQTGPLGQQRRRCRHHEVRLGGRRAGW